MFNRRFTMCFVAIFVLCLISQNAFSFGGLTGALDEVSKQINNSNNNSNSNSNTPAQTGGPAPSPSADLPLPPNQGANAPPPPDFGPIGGPSTGPIGEPSTGLINQRIVPAVTTPPVKDKNEGVTTVDPKTGVSTTTVTNKDGSKTITKKDKNGNILSEEFFPKGSNKPDVIKEHNPETGEVTTTVTNKDGSKNVIVTNSDGFLVSETSVPRPQPTASAYDPESGKTTSSVRNSDGSRTVTIKDKDGNVTSTETIPPPGSGAASASVYDPSTGKTTAGVRNPDGSRTVTVKDKGGNVVSQQNEPPPGKGEAFASTKDPQTGVTTTARGNKDGTRTISDSRSWKGDDGKEHTLATDNRGNQTEVVKDKDGSTVTTQWDKDNRKTETTEHKDGSKTVTSETKDGFVEEKVTGADGRARVTKKDHAGNVLETTENTADGRKVTTDELGVRTVTTPEIDGTYTVEKTDKKGNRVITQYDSRGNVVDQSETRTKPKESGERYFENELGGKFGEWDQLPQSAKNQYANSENEIIERTKAELLRQKQEDEKVRTQEQMKREDAERQKVTDEKLAVIQKEADEAHRRYEEFLKKQESLKKRQEAEDKMKDYDRQIYEALANGDKKKAETLQKESDEFHDNVLVSLETATPEEQKEIERKQAIRDKVAQRIISQARSVADTEILATEGVQDVKDTVTGKAKYLSIGAEMQEQTSKTTRMADREKAFAEAKQAEIARMLADPKTTQEEKDVLYGLLNMADLQKSGADQLLHDNAMITAAGYGIDVAMLVSGGELVGLAEKGVTGAAGKLLAKETAERVVTATTEKGILTLAGEGATKVATGAARRVAGEEAAKTVEKVLATDVGEVTANATERAATKVLGEAAVQTTKDVAAKVADVAATDVRDIPGKLRDSVRGAADSAEAGVAGKAVPKPNENPKSLADTWADDAAHSSEAPKTVTVDGKTQPAYADRTMPLETLEDYAKNPRVRTAERPKAVDEFPSQPVRATERRPNFVEARSAWKKAPIADRKALDQGVRDAIDEAAAMGDKWAKRLQTDLNNGKFKYQYEPGLKYSGVAPGDGNLLVNPLKGGASLAMDNPDKIASTILHEYVHSYKGPTKFAAEEGLMTSGTAAKGEYNEVRAFLGEANFNKNLRNARSLNGKSFDESTVKELDTLMGVDRVPSGPTSFNRGAQARDNLQNGLVNDYPYGKEYANRPDLAAERLSTFRGGSMTDIRARLRNARGSNGQSTPEYEKILKEIQDMGGNTTPTN